MEEYARNKGLEYHLYEETESTRKSRPVKQLMLEKAMAGAYESIVVYKLDRFARSSMELILDITLLTKKGIGFISLTDNLDFTTSSDMEPVFTTGLAEIKTFSDSTKPGLNISAFSRDGCHVVDERPSDLLKYNY